MIGFFKKFLKPDEEVVDFSEINKWLDDKNKEIPKIREKFQEIEELKGEVSENLKALGCVDLSKAKVEERVKKIVQGNLPAYVNAITFFLKRVVPPEDINHVSLEAFCNSFENEFEDLNKRTFRNFQIIKELVGKELEDVAKSVKNLELSVKGVKEHSSRVKAVAELKEKADFIRGCIENREQNLERREELQKEKENLLAYRKSLGEDIERLKNSSKAKELERLGAEERKISSSVTELENQITNLFSPLQKALKKYNNLHFIKKVKDYVERPANALLTDSELEILKFLKEVGKMLEEEKLDLKEDKRRKSSESLERLNESFFKSFLKEHCSLDKKLSSVKEEIKANTVMKEISNLEKELSLNSLKIESIEKEIGRIKDVNILDEISDLEKCLCDVFNRRVRIKHALG